MCSNPKLFLINAGPCQDLHGSPCHFSCAINIWKWVAKKIFYTSVGFEPRTPGCKPSPITNYYKTVLDNQNALLLCLGETG